MSRETVLAAARRTAESAMSGSCRITRTTPVSLDTGTLDLIDTDPSDDLVYVGVFRLRSPLSSVSVASTEGQFVATQQLTLCLPITAAGAVRVGDRVEILDGGLEPGLTGRTYRIAGLAADSWASEARLLIDGSVSA